MISIFHGAVVSLVGLFGFGALAGVYFLFFHEIIAGPHIVYHKEPYITDSANNRVVLVGKGDQLHIHWASTIQRDCPRRHEYMVRNGSSMFLGVSTGFAAKGDVNEWITVVDVPKGTPPGKKSLHVRSTFFPSWRWPCNPLREVVTHPGRFTFTVVAGG